MAKSVGQLSVLLSLNSRGFSAGMRRATAISRGFQRTIAHVGTSLASFRGLLGGAAVLGLGHWMKSSIEAADELVDLSDRLNVTRDGFQALSLVAKEAGASQDQLSTAIAMMSKNIGQAALGNKAAVTTFRTLGIAWAELKDLKADRQFALIAKRLGGVADHSKRAALAQEVFGRGASKLGLVLAGNEKLLGDARLFIARAGLSFDDSLAAGAGRAADAMGRIGLVVQGLGRRFAFELLPHITAAADGLNEFLNMDHGGHGPGLGGVLAKTASGGRNWLSGLKAVGPGIMAGLSDMQAGIGKWWESVGKRTGSKWLEQTGRTAGINAAFEGKQWRSKLDDIVNERMATKVLEIQAGEQRREDYFELISEVRQLRIQMDKQRGVQ